MAIQAIQLPDSYVGESGLGKFMKGLQSGFNSGSALGAQFYERGVRKDVGEEFDKLDAYLRGDLSDEEGKPSTFDLHATLKSMRSALRKSGDPDYVNNANQAWFSALSEGIASTSNLAINAVEQGDYATALKHAEKVMTLVPNGEQYQFQLDEQGRILGTSIDELTGERSDPIPISPAQMNRLLRSATNPEYANQLLEKGMTAQTAGRKHMQERQDNLNQHEDKMGVERQNADSSAVRAGAAVTSANASSRNAATAAGRLQFDQGQADISNALADERLDLDRDKFQELIQSNTVSETLEALRIAATNATSGGKTRQAEATLLNTLGKTVTDLTEAAGMAGDDELAELLGSNQQDIMTLLYESLKTDGGGSVANNLFTITDLMKRAQANTEDGEMVRQYLNSKLRGGAGQAVNVGE